jgi:hypothetical protein
VPSNALLDAFAYGTAYVPSNARSVLLYELPLRLYEIAQRCQVTGWRAWNTPGGLRFIEAAFVGDSDMRKAVLLELVFYDVDGVPVTAGIWQCDAEGQWHLQRVYELERFLRERRYPSDRSAPLREVS